MRTETKRTSPLSKQTEDIKQTVHQPLPDETHRGGARDRRDNKFRTKSLKMTFNRQTTYVPLVTMFLILAQSGFLALSQSMTSKDTPPEALLFGSSESSARTAPSELSSKLPGHRKLQVIQKPVVTLRIKRDDIEAEQPDESTPEMSVATRPKNSNELEAASGDETGGGATNSQRPQSHQHGANSKLHIVRLFAPDSIQNGTQDVTIDCMFKHDRKLDQRLAIKWFFNDELEPIYQWIPELNGRVYSKRYEHLIDKQYQVTEDVDFMLQAYKWLLGSTAGVDSLERDWDQVAAEGRPSVLAKNLVPPDGEQQQQQVPDEQQVAATRKLLANKLSRLAKLGGDHSRQLIGTLRTALAMDDQDVSRFRALRLLRPGVEMSGRFTCSISSLDGDDLKSTRLTVYEPPRSFTFNVSKTSSHTYNLTCQAGPTFPRPSIALYRYRPRQSEARPSRFQPLSSEDSRRLKSTTSNTKQELLPGTQVQLQISAKRPNAQEARDKLTESGSNGLPRISLDFEDELANSLQPIANEADEERKILRRLNSNDTKQPPGGPFEVSAWALVDEASLNNNLVTEFECVVSLEDANYELRQTLALQRGWHVNSSPLTAKSTLVGLMSILASLLCLTVALVSTILIFKLLRRHANKSSRLNGHSRRVSPRKTPSSTASDRGQSNGGCETASSLSPSTSPSTSPSDQSTMATMAPASGEVTAKSIAGLPRRADQRETTDGDPSSALMMTRSPTNDDRAMRMAAASHFGQKAPAGGRLNAARHVQPSGIYQQRQPTAYSTRQDFDERNQQFSDGIYRVPGNCSSFGTPHLAASVSLGNQQPIWSTPYMPSSFDASSEQAGQRYSFSGHPDMETDTEQHVEVGSLQHNGRVTSLHWQSNGIVTPASRGIQPLATNQLTGQKAQQRAHHQPATISVNGKQLYC